MTDSLLRQAAMSALWALDINDRWHYANDEHGGYPESELCDQTQAAIATLRTALAQQAAQPVALVPKEWRDALRKLAFMARTSGRTAGPDAGLMAALDEAGALLRLPYNYPAAQPQQATSCTDSHCPCQDGDTCHYADGADGTKAMQPQQAAPP